MDFERFQRSNDLKTDILNLSEAMFQAYGYERTTFQKIADTLGITKGAITYHFKNKYFIIDDLIQKFFQDIREHIDSYPEAYRNKYWRSCTMYIIAYRIIMRNARNQELFYNQDQMRLWETSKVQTVIGIYRDIASDFHKTFTEEELLITTYMDLGARRRLYKEHRENEQLLSIDKYCHYHVYLIGCLARLDEATIRENIHYAFAFVNSHPEPKVALFQ